MMTRLYSSTVLGVDGVEVEVEVDFRPMAEKRTFIVGLPDAAVKESGQRVDTAIQNSGLPFQQGIFVVNLAPADLRKQGPGFDLPIALGMVAGAAEKEMDASAWCIVENWPWTEPYAPCKAFCRKSWKRGAWAGSASCCRKPMPMKGRPYRVWKFTPFLP